MEMEVIKAVLEDMEQNMEQKPYCLLERACI